MTLYNPNIPRIGAGLLEARKQMEVGVYHGWEEDFN
jgi:hypothetical protein